MALNRSICDIVITIENTNKQTIGKVEGKNAEKIEFIQKEKKIQT